MDMRQNLPVKPSVLVFLWYYLPGRKSGAASSIANLVDDLGDDFTFRIVTSDRDLGDTVPYPGIEVNRWHKVGKAQVLYLPPRRKGMLSIARLMRETPHDLLYLNSFVNPVFTVFPLLARWTGLAPRRPAVLSPRGEFSEGALRQKSAKKRAYINFVRQLGLLSDVWLHATGAREEEEIHRIIPSVRAILNVPNTRILRPMPEPAAAAPDQRLRLVFLSRIDRMKNLDGAIRVLQGVRSPVLFDVYGPATDPDYWDECQKSIASLPPHIEVHYRGAIDNREVAQTLAGYDLFFLPTLGENFGHAIFDALEVGLPILISDQTPWQDLEREMAGWSLPLSGPSAFASAIDGFAQMSPADRARLKQGARRLAERYVNKEELAGGYSHMFRQAIASHEAACHQPAA
ncbi:MAG: glycosyltransferase family 4 protein [Rhodomicrobium sp.]